MCVFPLDTCVKLEISRNCLHALLPKNNKLGVKLERLVCYSRLESNADAISVFFLFRQDDLYFKMEEQKQKSSVRMSFIYL